MNSLLTEIKVQIVMSTGPTLGRLLFNNTNKFVGSTEPCRNNCFTCNNGLQNKSGEVTSTVTGISYKVDKDLTLHVIMGGYTWLKVSVMDNIVEKPSIMGIELRSIFTQVSLQRATITYKSVMGVMMLMTLP